MNSEVARKSLFTYLRYNADLSDASLIEQGIVEARQRKKLRKLDAAKSLPELEAIAQRLAKSTDFEADFAAFL